MTDSLDDIPIMCWVVASLKMQADVKISLILLYQICVFAKSGLYNAI